MQWIPIGSTVLAAFVGLVWFIRLVFMGRAVRDREVLGDASHPQGPPATPMVSVLVAAKDEQDNIETCVRTLLDQDYPNYEVIAIDDRSDDDTPKILARLQDEFSGRLTVITIEQLREGWFGKNNAMRAGIERARGDWFMLTDADCRQTSRRTISVAMAEVLERDVDFLSITPVLEARAWWEHIVQPVCALVLMIWFLPSKVNDPKKKTAYANGAFMLMNRRCYEGIGGHERVRTEVNEDIIMAKLAKKGGFHLRVTENDDLYRTRMYATPREAWRGWSRIFYGSLQTAGRLGRAIGMLSLYSLLPWVSLVVAGMCVALAVGDAGWWKTALVSWGVAVLLMQVVLWRFYGIVQIGRLWSLCYVGGATVALGMLISALLKVLGATGTNWRGTVYHGNQVTSGGGTGTPAAVVAGAESVGIAEKSAASERVSAGVSGAEAAPRVEAESGASGVDRA